MHQRIPSPNADLEQAVALLREGGASVVLVKGGEVLARREGHGIQPLLDAMDELGRARTRGAALADRVVGRAAVMVALWGGVRAVHGEIMSRAALRELQRRGMPHSFGRLVPEVRNRRGDGPCPFERAVSQLEDPEQAVAAIRAVGERLRGGEPGPGKARSGLPARTVVELALWLALGVALPLAVHPLGIGPALLPMHLPVLLAGALSGPGLGLLVGAVSPLLSHLLTGMPPMSPPIAALMTFELAAYGLVAGAVRRALLGGGMPQGRFSWVREYAWLLAAMMAGRLTLGAAAAVVGPALGLPAPAGVYLQTAVVTGIPGLLVQLAVLPRLVWQLDRFRFRRGGVRKPEGEGDGEAGG